MKVTITEFCHSRRSVTLLQDGRKIFAYAEIPQEGMVRLLHVVNSITGDEWRLRLAGTIDLKVNCEYQVINNN